MKTMWGVSAIVCFVIIIFISKTYAKVTPPKDTLHGLSGVSVFVEKLPPEIGKDGSYPMRIRRDVESQLRRAEITVLTREEFIYTTGKPYLEISIDSLKNESADISSVYVRVALRQEVYLSRGLEMNRELVKTSCVTWDRGTLGTVDCNKVPDFIRDQLEELVDSFIREYLVANQERAPE